MDTLYPDVATCPVCGLECYPIELCDDAADTCPECLGPIPRVED